MATLEKIRKRSVLLFVIIIVALLAFIMGDFLTSGRTFFSDPTTVAVIDGHKINIQEFQNRVEAVRAQQQAQGATNIDIAPIQQRVLDQMISEALMEAEMDKLGIVVTDAELSAAMTGATALPQIKQQVMQYGFETPEQFHDMAFNPAKYNIDPQQAQQLQQAWIELEKNTADQLRQQKFYNLFMGTLTANKLDAKGIYDENSTNSKILLAKQDLDTLKDEDFPVNDEDIKAQYNKYKEQFRLLEPVRVVDYIAVDVVPSAADITAAKGEIDAAVAALKAQPGTEGVNGNVNFGVKRQSVAKSTIPSGIKTALDSMQVGDVKVAQVRGFDYTIVKLFAIESAVDSINIDFAVVEGDVAQSDSIIKQLNGGAKSKELLDAGKLAQAQDSLWLRLTDPQLAQMKDMLLAAPEGQYVALDSVAVNGIVRLARVASKKAPVQVYDFAEIAYTVEPSTATFHTLEGELARFVNGNKDAKQFAENAPKSNYTVMPDHLTASSVQLGRLPDTREAVNWAMDAKAGQVSPIFKNEDGTTMVVVALNAIYEDDYVPVSDPMLNRQLTTMARNDKKAEKLINDYKGKGKSVEDYANLMKVSVDTAAINFAQPMFKGKYESALAGRAMAAGKGKLVGPFKGANSVMVFVVTDVENQGLPYDQKNATELFNRAQGGGVLGRNVSGILRGNKKVDNRIQKFYRK